MIPATGGMRGTARSAAETDQAVAGSVLQRSVAAAGKKAGEPRVCTGWGRFRTRGRARRALGFFARESSKELAVPATDTDPSGHLASALAAYLRAIEATVSAAVALAPRPAPPTCAAPLSRTLIVEDSDRPPLLVSVREGARMLNVSPNTLLNWSAPRGPIPFVKIGARRCYAVTDLEAAIARLRVPPKSHSAE